MMPPPSVFFLASRRVCGFILPCGGFPHNPAAADWGGSASPAAFDRPSASSNKRGCCLSLGCAEIHRGRITNEPCNREILNLLLYDDLGIRSVHRLAGWPGAERENNINRAGWRKSSCPMILHEQDWGHVVDPSCSA